MIDVPGTSVTYYSARNTGDWGFLACSGATSLNVMTKQLKNKSDPSNTNWIPLSSATQLVTITAGGDDLGWSAVLQQCYEDLHSCQNLPYKGYSSMAEWASAELSTLETNLVALYKQIKGDAPNAQILVLDYPQLLPSSPIDQACANLLPLMPKYPGLGSDEQDWLRGETTNLDNTIEDAVGIANAEANVGAVFLDVANVFKGHEACSSKAWINAPTISGIHVSKSHTWYLIKLSASARTESFHPTQMGADEYASVINQYLESEG
jgi:hypothetical protein